MGHCVTKSGGAAMIALPPPDAPSLPQQQQQPQPQPPGKDYSAATSPSTRPPDDFNNGSASPQLAFPERRRLSLSQSDPARADLPYATRGQLVINQLPRHTQRAQRAKPAKPAKRGDEDEDSSSESSLDEEQEKEAGTSNSDEEDEEDEEDEDDSDSDSDSSSSSSSSSANDRRLEAAAAAAAMAASRVGGGAAAARRPMRLSGTSSLTSAAAASGRPAKSGQTSSAGPQQQQRQQRQCRRLSVSGMPSAMQQDNFENKRQEVKSDTGQFDSNTLFNLGIGYACRKGLKPESPNQDDFFIVRIDDWGLYGVFDGHGPYGHDVSHFVQRELPKLVYNNPNFHSNPKEALRASFIAVHNMLEEEAASHRLFDCSLSGCTATVVLHRKTKLYAAHVGDSRCIMGRVRDNGSKVEAVDLTVDHKPNNEAEKQRIVAAGGQVRRLDGDIPHRVFLKGKLYPGLAMSRAIGDSVGAQAGVICEPDVTEWDLISPARDSFICLCSDGVWEFLTSAEVANVIHRNGAAKVQSSADAIARESWNRWIQEEGNVVDDITCEIIFLAPSAAPS